MFRNTFHVLQLFRTKIQGPLYLDRIRFVRKAVWTRPPHFIWQVGARIHNLLFFGISLSMDFNFPLLYKMCWPLITWSIIYYYELSVKDTGRRCLIPRNCDGQIHATTTFTDRGRSLLAVGKCCGCVSWLWADCQNFHGNERLILPPRRPLDRIYQGRKWGTKFLC